MLKVNSGCRMEGRLDKQTSVRIVDFVERALVLEHDTQRPRQTIGVSNQACLRQQTAASFEAPRMIVTMVCES